MKNLMVQIITIVMETIMIPSEYMEMAITFLSYIVAVIISLVAWRLSIWLYKPELAISKSIATRAKKEPIKKKDLNDNRDVKEEEEGRFFSIKLQNQSSIRGIYDISVYATYCYASKNYYSTKIRYLPKLKENPLVDGVVHVTSDMEPFEMKIILPDPPTKDEKKYTIEDFFNNTSGSGTHKPYVDIDIVASDKISGSVRHSYTMRYYYEDIKYEHVFKEGQLEPVSPTDNSSGYLM